jgi:hypothetical protein
LLNDPNGILVQQTKNVQSARQIRFTNVREIVKMKAILKAYIQESTEVIKAGWKVEFKKTTEFTTPEEFQKKLAEMPALRTAFESLTPGRQRAYLFYFPAPKLSLLIIPPICPQQLRRISVTVGTFINLSSHGPRSRRPNPGGGLLFLEVPGSDSDY